MKDKKNLYRTKSNPHGQTVFDGSVAQDGKQVPTISPTAQILDVPSAINAQTPIVDPAIYNKPRALSDEELNQKTQLAQAEEMQQKNELRKTNRVKAMSVLRRYGIEEVDLVDEDITSGFITHYRIPSAKTDENGAEYGLGELRKERVFRFAMKKYPDILLFINTSHGEGHLKASNKPRRFRWNEPELVTIFRFSDLDPLINKSKYKNTFHS